MDVLIQFEDVLVLVWDVLVLVWDVLVLIQDVLVLIQDVLVHQFITEIYQLIWYIKKDVPVWLFFERKGRFSLVKKYLKRTYQFGKIYSKDEIVRGDIF